MDTNGGRREITAQAGGGSSCVRVDVSAAGEGVTALLCQPSHAPTLQSLCHPTGDLGRFSWGWGDESHAWTWSWKAACSPLELTAFGRA